MFPMLILVFGSQGKAMVSAATTVATAAGEAREVARDAAATLTRRHCSKSHMILSQPALGMCCQTMSPVLTPPSPPQKAIAFVCWKVGQQDGGCRLLRTGQVGFIPAAYITLGSTELLAPVRTAEEVIESFRQTDEAEPEPEMANGMTNEVGHSPILMSMAARIAELEAENATLRVLNAERLEEARRERRAAAATSRAQQKAAQKAAREADGVKAHAEDSKINGCAA